MQVYTYPLPPGVHRPAMPPVEQYIPGMHVSGLGDTAGAASTGQLVFAVAMGAGIGGFIGYLVGKSMHKR
jgi:hypothetical protein